MTPLKTSTIWLHESSSWFSEFLFTEMNKQKTRMNNFRRTRNSFLTIFFFVLFTRTLKEWPFSVRQLWSTPCRVHVSWWFTFSIISPAAKTMYTHKLPTMQQISEHSKSIAMLLLYDIEFTLTRGNIFLSYFWFITTFIRSCAKFKTDASWATNDERFKRFSEQWVGLRSRCQTNGIINFSLSTDTSIDV